MVSDFVEEHGGSVVLVSNYCTIIVLVLVIMSVNNNSFSKLVFQ